jgi:bifunctional non-homologous end joining protein LigD
MMSGSSLADGQKRPIFVVQEHWASHHHFDFRLERKGVLLSWAVPKGIPLLPGQRHLAIKVEDHPLSYADFEGVIPEGEYGAGRVVIWDKGDYQPLSFEPGKIEVILFGQKLSGKYILVKTTMSEKSWLLICGTGDDKI